MSDENPGGGGEPGSDGNIGDSGVPPLPADEGGVANIAGEGGQDDPPPADPPPADPPPADPPPGDPVQGDEEGKSVEGAREDGGKYEPDDKLDTEPKLPDQNATDEADPEQEKAFVLPIYIYTAIFGIIFLFGPLLARRGPNVGITRCCIMISAFCCWIFWTTTYIVQMNPLLGPRLGNETLAWIGHKWGKNALYIRDTNETTESDDAVKVPAVVRNVADDGQLPEKALTDPLALKIAADDQQDLKVEPKDPPEEPPKEELPKEEAPKEEQPQEEEPSRRRLNTTNLFTNLTHLIRD